MRNIRSLILGKLSKSQLDPEDFLDFGADLEELQIVGSNLKTIKDHAFKYVKAIKKLDLSENKIEKIENDAFLEVRTLFYSKYQNYCCFLICRLDIL